MASSSLEETILSCAIFLYILNAMALSIFLSLIHKEGVFMKLLSRFSHRLLTQVAALTMEINIYTTCLRVCKDLRPGILHRKSEPEQYFYQAIYLLVLLHHSRSPLIDESIIKVGSVQRLL